MGVVRGLFWLVIGLLILSSGGVSASEKPGPEPESSCVSCHSGLGGDLAAPVALWEKSIHHQMGNNCEGCHGGDPADAAEAMSPVKGFVGSPKPDQIPTFCGKCHVGVVENYKKSPHYAAFQKGAGPSCITCHRSHDVQRASLDLITEALCSQCHSFENGQKMKNAFVTAETALKDTRSGLERLDHRGMPVKQLEEKLFALRNSLHQMTHTLDVPAVEKKTQSVLTDIEEMKKEMSELDKKVHRRWWIGAGVAAFLIVLIATLSQLLKTLEKEES